MVNITSGKVLVCTSKDAFGYVPSAISGVYIFTDSTNSWETIATSQFDVVLSVSKWTAPNLFLLSTYNSTDGTVITSTNLWIVDTTAKTLTRYDHVDAT